MSNHYSIIIPHHNIPQLLRRCLASIPNRQDVQVIVVDDKSDEIYQPILRQLESEYPWVEFVYSQEGKGAGLARNVGLKHAKGDYVLFADADDFFTYCIGQVFDDYAESSYDVIFFNANSLDTDTYAITYRSLHLNSMIRKYSKHPERAIFELKYAFGEPWCKMVKRKIIEENHIKFSETIIHNDTRYSYLIGYYCKDVQVDNRAIYCVTDRMGSVSKRVSLERLLARTEVFAEANQFFARHHIQRFDERGLRPFMGFLLKRDIVHAKQCVWIMKENGLTTCSILSHSLYFPFYIIVKSGIALKKMILNLIW